MTYLMTQLCRALLQQETLAAETATKNLNDQIRKAPLIVKGERISYPEDMVRLHIAFRPDYYIYERQITRRFGSFVVENYVVESLIQDLRPLITESIQKALGSVS